MTSGKEVTLTNVLYVSKGYLIEPFFKLNAMIVMLTINNNTSSSASLVESSNISHGRIEHFSCNTFKRLINLN